MATSRLTRAEQQARTRAALLDAGARVFSERGFAGASVEAISEAAGYTRGAFYSNFSTKEELFAELLQERVYSEYRDMADRPPMSLREVGEALAEIQDRDGDAPFFRLWLELIAHAGRDPRFKEIAAEFWRGNRARTAGAIEAAFGAAGRKPPARPDRLATAMIALDIGLAIQHFVDPEQVPSDVYPELYELLFAPHSP